MSKLYHHPIDKSLFVPKEEYFQILESKTYELYLGDFNKPL